MVNPRAELFEFVITKLEHEPASRKARMLRVLSEFAGDATLTKELSDLAADIECADQRCAEFAFKFKQEARR